MFDSLILTSYYELYVLLLHAAIQLALFLSLLVSLDRVLNVCKYAVTRLATRLTGRQPRDAWHFQSLPEETSLFPKVGVAISPAG